MKEQLRIIVGLLAVLVAGAELFAAVPQQINHQGVVAVNGQRFSGTGTFFFSLIANGGAGSVLWANNWNGEVGDPVPLPDGRATVGVQLSVADGVYSANLGGGTMKPIPPQVFNNGDVVLRIWFKDAPDPEVGHGIQQLQPDQVLSTAPFATRAFKSGMAEKLVIPGTETDALVVDDEGNVETANLSLTGGATVGENLQVGGVFNGAKGVFVDLRQTIDGAEPPDGSTNWIDVFVATGLEIPAGTAIVNWAVKSWAAGGNASYCEFRMLVGDATSPVIYHRPDTSFIPQFVTGIGGMQTNGGDTIKLQARRRAGWDWRIDIAHWTVIVFRD